MEPVFTTASYFLFSLIALLVGLASMWERYHKDGSGQKGKESQSPPSPFSLPILGHLHLMAGYEVPFEAFNVIKKKFGNVVELKLGTVKCVVVSGMETIREVLITKAAHFDGRPGFKRYHQLFGGNKENSLAFCDYSEVQRIRRDMLKTHMFPRAFSARFHLLDNYASTEIETLIQHLDKSAGKTVHMKNELLSTFANVFTSYFCSTKYDLDDPDFQNMVKVFDEIFYEVNQGCLADFFPWMIPMYNHHLSTMANWSHEIRNFMMRSIIEPRKESYSPGQEDTDLVGSIVEHMHTDKDSVLTWENALFALEDILGGHSAVGNMVMRLIAYVVPRPEVKNRIFEEITNATGNNRMVSLSDREKMPYTEATIFETIRHISSPIVPHLANQDSTIGGYNIEKGTTIFINNYDLNISSDYWNNPEAFTPERFLAAGKDKEAVDDNNNDKNTASLDTIKKPDHFIPFSTGRRSCLGYKMLQYLAFLTLSNLLQKFDLKPAEGENYNLIPGSLAVPTETFKLIFERR